MTLQNGAVIGKQAYLWTDTAYFSADGGEILGHDTKACYGLEWPFAVSWSLVGPDQGQIARHVNGAYPSSIRDLLECCRDALLRFCGTSGGCGRLMIAAYDKVEEAPRLFLISSASMLDYPAYAPMEGLSFVSSHADSVAYRAALAKGFSVSRMLDVVDTQRQTPFLTEMGGQASVAGNCVQIEVSRTGVASSVAMNLDAAR